MSAEQFTLDSNILVYSVDPKAGFRHGLAREIVYGATELDCTLTLQAASEFFRVVTHKGLLAPRDALAATERILSTFPIRAGSADGLRSAMPFAVAGRASFWDAVMIATAAEAGCTAIITEDGHPGAVLNGVRIVPPFAGDALSPQVKELLGL